MLSLGLELPTLARRRPAAIGFDFAGGVLPAGASLTRASPGARLLPTGVLATEAADVPRFDHRPVTHGLRGLLIEEARSNGYTATDALDNNAWLKSAVSVSANVATAPDGTVTADLIVPSATSTQHFLRRSQAPGTATVVFSGFFKPGGYDVVQLYGNGGIGLFNWNVDLASGAETAFVTSTSTVVGRGISAHDDGWWRLWIAVTPISTATAYFVVQPSPAASATRAMSFTGDGTSGTLAWGLQLETGAAVSSYMAAPGGATAAREADVLVLDWGSRGVADGVTVVRYTFDDGSTQDVATGVSGGCATVPTNLARRWIVRAEKI